MKTFKAFLEAGVKPFEIPDKIPDTELLSLIKKHANLAWEGYKNRVPNPPNVIWRGTELVLPAGIYNPSTGERKSENTTNQYTELFDSNPANSNWPKRSKSFICSTDYGYANMYGRVYLVLPFDETPVAAVKTNDLHALWKLKDWNTTDYPSINVLVMAIMGLDKTNAPRISFSQFRKTVDDLIKEYHTDKAKTLEKWQDIMAATGRTFHISPREQTHINDNLPDFLNALVDTFTFDKNEKDFILYKNQEEFLAGDNSDREVWLSGKCFLVPQPLAHFLDKN